MTTTAQLLTRDGNVIAGIEKLRFSPLAAVRGEGAYLIDPDGRRILDLSASWGAASLGYAHPRVVAVVAEAASQMAGASILSSVNEPAVTLAEELLAIVPGNGPRRVWLGHSGSDANEAAIRAIQLATGRARFIAFEGSYHGGTLGSMAVSGHPAQIGAAHPGRVLLPFPDPYRGTGDDGADVGQAVLDQLDELLSGACPGDTVAAILVEPLLSDGGLIVPPAGFLSGLRDRCDAHGILLLCDEVKVGLGRSGLMHAFEHDGIVPDVVTLGKALGGGLPLSAAVGPAAVMDCQPGLAILSTAGNPVCAAAGSAVLAEIGERDLAGNADRVGRSFRERLRALADKHEMIGDVRGLGLAIGIDLVSDRRLRTPAPTEAAKVVVRALELGCAFFCVGIESNVLELTPPLILSQGQVDEAVDIIDQAIADVSEGRVSDDAIAAYAGWAG